MDVPDDKAPEDRKALELEYNALREEILKPNLPDQVDALTDRSQF
jgi:hypothetical protein